MNPQPRVIEILFAPFDSRPEALHVHKYISTIPTILHVNRESREKELRHYKISSQAGPNAMNQFYFNPAIDTLDIGSPSWRQWYFFLNHNECRFLNQAQKITAHCKLFLHRPAKTVKHLAASCPALREIIIVNEPDEVACMYAQLTDDESECVCRTLGLGDILGGLVKEGKPLAMEFKRLEVTESTFFQEPWKKYSETPCPGLWSLDICINSRHWCVLKMEEVNRFVGTRVSKKV